MKTTHLPFVTLLVLALASASVPAQVAAPGSAQQYPTGPIRLIVPFPPGGTADPAARAVAQKVSERLGQQILIDNRSGGSTVIGTEFVARAAPDGYTLLSAPFNFAANPALFAKLPYDPAKDFVPVTLLGATPLVLITHPSFPARTVKELIARARAKPREINYASSGSGSSNHLGAELFNQLAGVRLEHVAYKGSAPAVIAVVAGEVPVGIPALPSAIEQIKAGRIRGLAIASRVRARAMPELVTMTEAGVPGCEVEAWHGVMAPAGTPAAIIARLSKEIQGALRDRDVIARYDAVGFEPRGGSPEEFARFVNSEMVKWSKVIKTANIKAD